MSRNNKVYFLATIFLFIIEWLIWDIDIASNGLMANLVWVIYGLFYIILTICQISIIIKNRKDIKSRKTIYILAFALISYFYIPYSSPYIILNHKIFKNQRQTAVEMIINKEDSIERINGEKYKSPFRIISQTSTIYIDDEKQPSKYLFYLQKNFLGMKSVLVYTTDENDFVGGFNIEFYQIKKIEDNWYSGIAFQ